MPSNATTANFYKRAAEAGLYVSAVELEKYIRFVFQDVNLNNKTVLDIGGGSGVYSFSMAALGASKVVCMEPEADGSGGQEKNKIFTGFRDSNPDMNSVELSTDLIQTYDASADPFDTVLMHNSVNHLDEEACMALLDDSEAQKTYVDLFAKTAGLMKPGGTIVVADAARKNFWGALGLSSPFCHSIEWHKHQQPKTWARLMEQAGFENPRIHWRALSKLGGAGFLVGNALGAFFTHSYFVLTMDKKS